MFVTPAYAEDNTAQAATTTQTSTAHEGANAGGVFPPFDQSTYPSQILWLVITFGFLFLVMQKVVAPRLTAIITTRNDKIARDLKEAARLKAEADSAVETYEKELADARKRGAQIASEAAATAKEKASAERAAIEADLAANLEAAQQRIGEIKTKAFAEVDQIATATAQAIVKQLAGLEVSENDLRVTIAQVKGA